MIEDFWSVGVASISVVELLGVGWGTDDAAASPRRVEDGGVVTTDSNCDWELSGSSGVGAFEGEEESDGSGGLSHEEGRLVN